MTRDPSSTKAKALSDTGIEVARADLSDVSTIKPALDGADAVFLMTDFFATMSGEAETQQAKNALDIIATLPQISHVIWSSLPSMTEISGGKYTGVVHFDSKAAVTKYVREECPRLWEKTTVLYLAAYYQLWLMAPLVFAPKRKEGEETYVTSVPWDKESQLPSVDVKDTGIAVEGILEQKEKLGGKIVSLVADDTTPMSEMVSSWGRIIGVKTSWQPITDAELAKQLAQTEMPEFLVKDMTEVIATYRDFQGKVLHGKDIIMAKEVSSKSGSNVSTKLTSADPAKG